MPEALREPYACPRTGQPLELAGRFLSLPAGGQRYPVRDGVPDFRVEPEAEDRQQVQKLARLVELARTRGWESALAEVIGPDAHMYRYVTDTTRARFLDLLPLTPHSAVLELGPGLGQFTAAIAARAGYVHALEVVLGQALFVQERCRQSGARNVSVACGGDDCRLPYVRGFFDVAICNLVFEWCASRDRRESFEAAQVRLLGELARVLKAGGVLFLATKNRYALSYLLGRPDEHAYGLRFGNALPRRLLGHALRRRGKDRPGGLLHSHRRLSRMLRDSGFARVESYWAAPEMRFPERYVRNDPRAIRAARREGRFAQGHTRLTRLLTPWVPARLLKHITPGLVFVAYRADDRLTEGVE